MLISDDPWNQTAADNAEWLLRFKRDVGIIKEGPGLPLVNPWAVKEGGSGFAPPYTYFKDTAAPQYNGDEVVQVPVGPAGRQFETSTSAANRYLQTISSRYPRPGRVFCARELEEGLRTFVQFEVKNRGQFPDDDALRRRGRDILGTQDTAADDQVLLGKFKKLMQEELSGSSSTSSTAGETRVNGGGSAVILAPIPVAPSLTSEQPFPPDFGKGLPQEVGTNMDVNMTDNDISNMLMHDMNFDTIFEQQTMEMGGTGS